MVDYIADFMNGSIYGVPFPLLLFLALFVIFIMWVRPRDEPVEKPKIIEPEREILGEFKDLIETNGTVISGKVLLRQGVANKGRVVRWAFYRYEPNVDIKALNKKNKSIEKLKEQVKSEYVKENFYILEVIRDSLVWYLIYKVLGLGTAYHLVDMRFVKVDQDFSITMFAQQQRFYPSVYVYSGQAKEIVAFLTNHLTVKQVLKETVNHIPQMHYFDYKTGRFASKVREVSSGKAKSWKEREENLEKEVDDE